MLNHIKNNVLERETYRLIINGNYNNDETFYMLIEDHIENPIEYMGSKLPMPYSLTEIDRIKDFANHIYANYDLNGKAMWENMAIGMGFGQFTTYLNATIGNYFSKKRLVESDKFE